MDNTNLRKAMETKNDEFYTLMPQIEDELSHYTQQFRNKIVYCNCDKPSMSNFYKYFKINFRKLHLKKLICTYYSKTTHPFVTIYNGKTTSRRQLKGNGSFDSPECINLLKSCDMVVTNPPFSLFRDYFNILVHSGKKFLIIGGYNALTNKELFPYIMVNKVRLGFNNGPQDYMMPNGKIKDVLTAWYTNLPVRKRNPKLELTKKYNKKDYPKYDTYNAIECGSVNDIPKNYNGKMGVPVTYLLKRNNSQFDLIGELRHGTDNKYDFAKPIVKGKEKFARLLIKKVKR